MAKCGPDPNPKHTTLRLLVTFVLQRGRTHLLARAPFCHARNGVALHLILHIAEATVYVS